MRARRAVGPVRALRAVAVRGAGAAFGFGISLGRLGLGWAVVRGRAGSRVRAAAPAAVCAALWCGTGLALAFVPGVRAGPAGAVVLAGWSLGLIPLHAVPVRPRRPRTGSGRGLRAPRVRPPVAVPGQAAEDGGAGPRWQRGHQ